MHNAFQYQYHMDDTLAADFQTILTETIFYYLLLETENHLLLQHNIILELEHV